MGNGKKFKGTILDEKKVSKVDTNSAETRLPAIILVDSSGSMGKYDDLVRSSLKMIYDEILSDPVARKAVELGVISFNEVVNILQPPCEIYNQKARGRDLKYETEGQTLTGFAVQEALYQFDVRLQEHKSAKSGARSYAPILIIISDGAPFCAVPSVQAENLKLLDEACKIIKSKVENQQLNVICFAIGNECNYEVMQRLTGTDNPNRLVRIEGECVEGERIAEIFKMSSSVIIKMSNSGKFDTFLDSAVK